MAALLDRQLIARVTGQASRRGLILRQPSGEQLLADVEAWLLAEYPEEVRRTALRPTGEDQAQLLVALHPAARDLRMLAWDNGRVDVLAETVTAGPGYHRFVGRVLRGDSTATKQAPLAGATILIVAANGQSLRATAGEDGKIGRAHV